MSIQSYLLKLVFLKFLVISSYSFQDFDSTLLKLVSENFQKTNQFPLNLENNLTNNETFYNNTNKELSCYSCSSNDGQNCDIINSTINENYIKKCKPNEPYCSVLRIEYKVPKELNWTLWTLERGCYQTCEPICIKLGERTRVRFCHTCCNESLCNYGNASSKTQCSFFVLVFVFLVFFV